MRKGETMKKRNNIILTAVFILLCTLTCTMGYAQIYLGDDDHDNARVKGDLPSGGFVIPNVPNDHDTTWDYTPIGDGLWLLGGLAGAYLIGKRKRRKDND